MRSINELKPRLSGEQRKIAFYPSEKSLVVLGGAGTGKTVVGTFRLYQALYPNELFPIQTKAETVGYIAFNKALALEVRDEVRTWGKKCAQVSSFDALVRSLLPAEEVGDINQTAQRQARDLARQEVFAAVTTAIAQKADEFYADEIAWIKGRAIDSIEAYQAASREGRGSDVRVTQANRVQLWNLFTRYNELLHTMGFVDWEDRHLRLRAKSPKPFFLRLVIDEAQDLSPVMLEILLRLVDWEHGGSITLLSDNAQHIYPRGCTPRELRAALKPYPNIPHRPFTLIHNYRNPRAIAEAAELVLGPLPPEEESTQHELPAETGGNKPEILWFGERTRNYLKQLITADLRGTVVAFATSRLLSQNRERLKAICDVELKTFRLLKGHEFRQVILIGCSDEHLPKSEDEAANRQIRKLLYIAMTRATERLTFVLKPTDTLSPFLEKAREKCTEIR